MKLEIDREADALYVRLFDVVVVDSEEVQSGVVVDYDQDGRIVAFEVLRLSSWQNPIELEMTDRTREGAA